MPLDREVKDKIREAFRSGSLRVKSIIPGTNDLATRPMSNVLRHGVSHKRVYTVTLSGGGSVTATEDHSLFRIENGIPVPFKASDVSIGDFLAVVSDRSVIGDGVTSVREVDRHKYMYDLTVPGTENFALSNGIVAHNSYSIGGISLDIERSSKYMDLKRNAEEMFDKATGAGGGEGVKQRTTKFLRGLQQPRFGIGVRSAFGPRVARGVLSPRAFL